MSHSSLAQESAAVSVYAYTAGDNSYCSRGNTLASYIRMNREVDPPPSCLWVSLDDHIVSVSDSVSSRLRNHSLAKNHRRRNEQQHAIDGTMFIWWKRTVSRLSLVEQVSRTASIPATTFVKKSVLGRGCTIGESVKIENSIIMDEVTIADGYINPQFGWEEGQCVSRAHCSFSSSQIKNSVIGNKCSVRAGSLLSDCIVGHGAEIAEKSKFIIISPGLAIGA